MKTIYQRYRNYFLWVGLLLALLLLMQQASVFMDPDLINIDDFVEY